MHSQTSQTPFITLRGLMTSWDIAVVAAEGDERCLGGLRMHRTQFRYLKLHNSHFLY